MMYRLKGFKVLSQIAYILDQLDKKPLTEDYTRPYPKILEEIKGVISDHNPQNEWSSEKFERLLKGCDFTLFLGPPGELPGEFVDIFRKEEMEIGQQPYPDWFITAYAVKSFNNAQYIFPMKAPLLH